MCIESTVRPLDSKACLAIRPCHVRSPMLRDTSGIPKAVKGQEEAYKAHRLMWGDDDDTGHRLEQEV